MRRMGSLSLRGRLMALFCATVGTWLAGSLLLLYLWLSHTARVEFDRRMLQVAVPVATDLATDRQAEYIAQLNIPNEYFELFDAAGRTLSRSRNLAENLPPPPEPLAAGQVRFYDRTSAEGPVRILAMPVRMGEQANVLLIAVSTTDLERWLHNLRSVFLLLLVFSLVVLALVSGWFASGSLRPISTLTRHAEHLAEEIRKPGGDTTQMRLPAELTRRRDELGRLAQAFETLWEQMRRAVTQLRQFVADASHELRTPLTVLRGETELLLEEPRSPQAYREALETIQEELGKLNRIVEGLFTLTLADAGQLRLAREPLYLNEVLEEACRLAERRAAAKQMRIERSLETELPYTGDESLLRQLFLIFLDNAVKYAPPGSTVRVLLSSDADSIRIRFEDQGPGIAPDELPRIFERFYRGRHGEAQSGGLCLSIAQAIARAFGGSITCTSHPGQGTCFTLQLPATAALAGLNKN